MSTRNGGLGCVAAGVFGLVLAVVMVLMALGAAHQQAQATGGIGTVGTGDRLKPGAAPEQYVPLIEQAAQTCPEITAPLLAAQLQQESGWDPTATSPVGAQGLAQFMPSTWASSGRDGDGDGAADPQNPADAITSQASYMCDRVRQVRDSGIPGDVLDLALAAYNAGLGAVEQYQGIPPYSETQNYVRRIRKLAADLAVPAPAPGDSAAGGWVVPADGRCSSGFGPRWGTFHKGQDIAGEIGTPIVAAAGGSVIAAGPASGYGQWVKVQHPGDVVTIYGHVDSYAVQVGQQVSAGQPIAAIGNRGQSTGPHLHFQIDRGGEPIDPVSHYQQLGAPPLCS